MERKASLIDQQDSMTHILGFYPSHSHPQIRVPLAEPGIQALN